MDPSQNLVLKFYRKGRRRLTLACSGSVGIGCPQDSRRPSRRRSKRAVAKESALRVEIHGVHAVANGARESPVFIRLKRQRA
jgi:hypothetical protein